jgi:hypothetical protein
MELHIHKIAIIKKQLNYFSTIYLKNVSENRHYKSMFSFWSLGIYKIWVFHINDDDDGGGGDDDGDEDVILGFYAMQTHTYTPTIQRNILSPSSGLKMETVCFPKMRASTYVTTWQQNLEHHNHWEYAFKTVIIIEQFKHFSTVYYKQKQSEKQALPKPYSWST